MNHALSTFMPYDTRVVPQVLLEILSGLPPVDENRDPKLLVSSER